MAIWQFDFHIIPDDFLNTEIKNTTEYLWDYKEIIKSNVKVPEFLKIIKSNDDEIQCGDYDKTYINFSFENNYLYEIFCRLDLRELNIDLFKEIVRYFQQINGCVLYGNRIYVLNGKVLKELIMNSNSYKFCAAPLEFFNDLKNNKINL